MKGFGRIAALCLSVLLAVLTLLVPASAADSPFADVPETIWYRDAVTYAYESGLLEGAGDTEFCPDAPMTRAVFVQWLARKAGNYDEESFAGASGFSDVDRSAWYAAPIEWARQMGLVSGRGNGRFWPESSITREEMAVILYQYARKMGNDISFDTGCLDGFMDGNQVSGWARKGVKWAISHYIIKGSGGWLRPQDPALRCEAAQVHWNAKELLKNNTPVEEEAEPVPTDPTPQDLPQGALTYGEFVEMFPNRKLISEKNLCLYVDGPGMDAEKSKALEATGRDILKTYAVAQIQTLRDCYPHFDREDIVVLRYSLDNEGRGAAVTLWYFPDHNMEHVCDLVLNDLTAGPSFGL